MEAPPRLTPGAVQAIAEQPDGAETGKPVLQVLDVRPVTTTNSERFRMALSDGVHAQQSMLATALNHLVTDGALRPGAIVHLLDMTCSTIQKRRIIIVVKLDILQSECTIIGSPKMYETKSLSKGQEPNLPANAAQTNIGTYSGGPGMRVSSVAPRTEQFANTPSYGGPYNGVHGTMGSSIGRKDEPDPNSVLSGGSYGTVSAQNTMNANVAQPKSQQPLLNSHQNQRFAVPTAGAGVTAPGNTYGRPAQPSYQQQPLAYMNRGPVAKREAASRVIPISALNPYQNGWTIKARVTAKSDLKHFNNARGPGKVFSFDLLDAHGGEIRATCFNEILDRFFDLIEVDKVYLISRGSLKPADKRYNNLNNEYEMNLDTLTSVDICSGDDSSIPKQHFNFRLIEEIENMDKGTIVDLLGVVTSVSPSGTIMRKNGTEVQKRSLQLKDMSGRSVEITFWGSFCDAEGQQLQMQCDSGLTPILALKGVLVNDFGGRSAGTISSSMLKINPDFPEAERLREWYITEGKTVAYVSLSRESSSMGRTDVRKTTAQIKDENLGRSEKPDWITVKGAISHLNTESFSYPACTLEVNGKRCTKKVTNIGDGTWNCEKCDQSSPNCEHRYLLLCQIQDHTGTTYATAFQEAGEEIFGMTAQKLFTIRDVDQDDVQFATIIQGVRWQQYLFKLKVKEETFNDEARVKCSIIKAEKLDPSKECPFVLGAIDNLLLDGLSSNNPGVDGSVALNAGFTNVEAGHSVVTSNNAYATNTGGANQFGQQASISGGMCGPLSARQQQPPACGGFTGSSYGSLTGPTGLCFKCNQPGHMARECPGLSSAPAPVAGSGLCFKCNQPGHFARDCPGHQRPQAYGNSAASGVRIQ